MIARTGQPTDRATTDTEMDLEFAHMPRDLAAFTAPDEIPIPSSIFRTNKVVDLADRAGLRAQRIDRTINEHLQITSAAAVESVKHAAKSAREAGYREGYVRGTHCGIWCGLVVGVLGMASAVMAAHHWMGL